MEILMSIVVLLVIILVITKLFGKKKDDVTTKPGTKGNYNDGITSNDDTNPKSEHIK